MKQKQSASLSSYKITLEPGTYLFCTCGYSLKQPLCDCSHDDSGFDPIEFKVEEKKLMKLCGCKESKLGHLCDNTHRELKKARNINQ